MEFSINFSTQAAVLLDVGRLKLDRFKCPDWPDLIEEASHHRPVAVHFNLAAGRGKLTAKNLGRIAKLADRTRTPYINLHLEPKKRDFPDIAIDSSDPAQRERVIHQALEEVLLAVDYFGRERVILENAPYRPAGNLLRFAVEPEVIDRIVQETGCGLLLDLPHARISASHLGIPEQEYLARLPVQRLKELHFTGVMDFGGWLQDHVPAQPADWIVLEWVLDNIRQGRWQRPWMLAFEYGGVGEAFTWRCSAQAIEGDGRRLYQLVNPL